MLKRVKEMTFKPYTSEEQETIYADFKKQHEQFVPKDGKADTTYGEILRAVGWLSHCHRRSGHDEFWLGAEEKAVGNFAGYLSLVRDLNPLLSDCVFYRLRGDEYGNFLTNLQVAALEWMKKHPNEPNGIDSIQVDINPNWNLDECSECGELTKIGDLENNGLGQHFCPDCSNKHYQAERKAERGY